MTAARETLAPLLIALDASPSALRKDECGDYRIDGSKGHIYPDGSGAYQVFVLDEKPASGLHSRWSKQGWTHCKRALKFMTVTGDGDLEGTFRLDRLPTQDEADLIRKYCGIRQKTHHSDETLARLRTQAAEMNAARVVSDQKTDEE